MSNKVLHINPLTNKEVTNLLIQSTAFGLLREDPLYDFSPDANIPRGLIAEVRRRVQDISYQGVELTTGKTTVANVITKMQRCGWGFVAPQMDRRQSRYNSKIFDISEQLSIRDAVRNGKLKVGELSTQFSKKKGKEVEIKSATARRILKRQLAGQPSMWPAKPKRMKVGGRTDHHRRCRLQQAFWIIDKGQAYVDGMIMADESKMKFRINVNQQIDILWVFRGEAEQSNWVEDPKHPGQINLFIAQSKNGIEYHELYDRNMNKTKYKSFLKIIGSVVQEADIEFSCYVHDNVWRGNMPERELNRYIGPGKWTRYMGPPCKEDHPTQVYKSGKPRKVHKPVCTCNFPDGPVHAAYNPKMNLTENTFAEVDAQLKRNHAEDMKKIPPRVWVKSGAGKKAFWKRELERAVNQVGANKKFFVKQYNGYLKRARAFVESRGKRLTVSKW